MYGQSSSLGSAAYMSEASLKKRQMSQQDMIP